MVKVKHDFEKFDAIFYPKHIAFIGASENSKLGSMLFLTAFKKSGWSDTFYPVNPKYDKILDWKCYPSVLDIPFPVDTAYISLKTKLIPKVIKELRSKKNKTDVEEVFLLGLEKKFFSIKAALTGYFVYLLGFLFLIMIILDVLK